MRKTKWRTLLFLSLGLLVEPSLSRKKLSRPLDYPVQLSFHKKLLTRTSFQRQLRSYSPIFCRGGAPIAAPSNENILNTSKNALGWQILKNNLLISSVPWTTVEKIYGIMAGLMTVIASMASFFQGGNGTTILCRCAAWLGVCFSLVAVVLQRRLTDLEGLRQLTNRMRDEVNELQATNVNLNKRNSDLERCTRNLEKAESSLAVLTEGQGMTVDALVKQVENYKKIQNQMKQNLKDEIRQTLLSVVIRSDRDQDYVIDPEEVDSVCLRLENLPNVKFDARKFRSVLKKEGGSIMEFSKRHLCDDAVIENEKMFVF